MSDFVVISDDMVQFDPAAGNAIVVPVPAKIKGTSKAKHGKNTSRQLCHLMEQSLE